MGETGCGKTHLIRFMCQFAKYNNRELQNMFILKVKSINYSNCIHSPMLTLYQPIYLLNRPMRLMAKYPLMVMYRVEMIIKHVFFQKN